jgi:hypothetical protein
MKTPNAPHTYRAVTAGSGFFVNVFESADARTVTALTPPPTEP